MPTTSRAGATPALDLLARVVVRQYRVQRGPAGILSPPDAPPRTASGGSTIMVTLDVHAVAVDAATGREVWRTQLGDINTGETATMAPIVVNGKVLVGNSGGEFALRGWLAALDAATDLGIRTGRPRRGR